MAALLAVPASRGAEVLDRVVASVGDAAITQSDVEQECRLEMFLDGQFPAAPDAASQARARERLASQQALALELPQAAALPDDLQKAARQRLDTVRQRFGSSAPYASALQAVGMTETQILDRLIGQQRILNLVDLRFRPLAAVTPAEVETYYRSTFIPEYQQRNGGTPPELSQVESQIREILVQKKIDALLAEWLDELQPSHRVRFHSF